MPATTRLVPVDRTSLLPQCSPAWRVLCPYPAAYRHYEQQYFPDLFYNRQALSALNSHCTPRADRQDLNDMQLTLLSSQFTPSVEYYSDWPMDLDVGDQHYIDDDAFFQITDSQNMEDAHNVQSQFTDFHYNHGTLEPNMMLRHLDTSFASCSSPLLDTDVVYSDYSHLSPLLDSPPAYQPATYSDPIFYNDQVRSPTFSDDTLCSSPCRQQEDEEDLPSKPYAKLIYEALMQAPEHRMSLRDIYQWFTKHTTKPQRSRGKGWQNSIRHNLSMNKAFDNDKSSLSPANRASRKANSMWVLTAHAVKHGVQSTTRYRKPVADKRRPFDHNLRNERLKSGTEGACAVRRGADRSRKHKKYRPVTVAYSPPDDYSHFQSADGAVDDISNGQPMRCADLPLTPPLTAKLEQQYALPKMQDAVQYGPLINFGADDTIGDELPMLDFDFYTSTSPVVDRKTGIDMD